MTATTHTANNNPMAAPDVELLQTQLKALKLPQMLAQYQGLAHSAATKHWSHVEFLTELVSAEFNARSDSRVQRLLAQARFPVAKTLDQFDWSWPVKINRPMVQNLFHLDFVKQHDNVVFIAGTGLGKSHLMTALGRAACLRGHSVLFTGAIDIVNTLAAAQAVGSVKQTLNRYIKPALLCVDELGYLPIDKSGADGLFQIISHRYEHGSTLITTNRVYSQWAGIFNGDAVLTSALLDRLLHHAQTVTIEGKSYRSGALVEL